MTEHEFTYGSLACGLGFGSRGVSKAIARLGSDTARFVNKGGVDYDPDACKDFRKLTGAPALQADLHKLQPRELREFMGPRRPDMIITSTPCKGLSRLLGREAAEQEKYQELNSLLFKSIFLAVESWPEDPVPTFVLENVPGITSRGAHLLHQIRELLTGYGYRIHEGTHDCGVIGGLAQHRRRFLLVARREKVVTAFVYKPPKKRVRGCGEVLGQLPMPNDPAAGPLHRLPKINWLNWVRLALIPAGGDWRDLPKRLEPAPDNPNKHTNKYAIAGWEDPARTVTGSIQPGSGGPAVAYPRPLDLGVNHRKGRYTDQYRVQDWDEPAATVTGVRDVQAGAPIVADPRGALGLGRTADNSGNYNGCPGLFGVNDWNEPSKAVTGSMAVASSNTPAAVADPRVAEALAVKKGSRLHGGALGVNDWKAPSKTVTGSMSVTGSNTPASVADPRFAVGDRRNGTFGVIDWKEPSPTVTGSMEATASDSPASVADPRVALGHEPRKGSFGVLGWEEPAHAVTGSMSTTQSNTPASVADPRLCSPLEEGQPRREVFRRLKVNDWKKPSDTVTGPGGSNGAEYVSDPRIDEVTDRVPLTCVCRNGSYGVMSWQDAAATITGSGQIDNGRVAVADPRKPPEKLVIIIAADGTWHRPLTDLDLVALQGGPATIDGKPLELSRGGGISSVRERIGNAIPEGAGEAIGCSLLKALLASKLGTWSLSSDEIWVRKDGLTEDDAPYEMEVTPEAA